MHTMFFFFFCPLHNFSTWNSLFWGQNYHWNKPKFNRSLISFIHYKKQIYWLFNITTLYNETTIPKNWHIMLYHSWNNFWAAVHKKYTKKKQTRTCKQTTSTLHHLLYNKGTRLLSIRAIPKTKKGTWNKKIKGGEVNYTYSWLTRRKRWNKQLWVVGKNASFVFSLE